MIIRRAEEKDIGGILKLLSQVLEIHARIRPDIFIPGTTKYSAAELAEILRDDTHPVFVAVDGADAEDAGVSSPSEASGNKKTNIAAEGSGNKKTNVAVEESGSEKTNVAAEGSGNKKTNVAAEESGNAKTGNSMLGYVFCAYEEPSASANMIPRRSLYIDDLCVDESARGRHVGRALFDYVLEEARKSGCYEITLNVWEGNDSARAFYERVGFGIKKTMMEFILPQP
jgi:ribosomal protein S18 acetylase RimI-like enzyme